ncbi:SpoIIE family protein phosphatase [Streptomyces sp. DSM 44917]|uniref:SpoIIE family protein phosphatase n=1 Tax=Streptomyces boetiae TaxID=3075541 RepID=A0ABU2L9V0_9ACTN|nr:SpoIIE family protein phosphatase [Streptomyces sp. DSM 44917]MDT0308350.1 SpoIIE family protein phosphatase [Streptomyces sp. DSM 44917]
MTDVDAVGGATGERAALWMLRVTPDAVLLLDAGDWRVRYANPAAGRLFLTTPGAAGNHAPDEAPYAPDDPAAPDAPPPDDPGAPGVPPVGRVAWEALPVLRDLGFPERGARAVARGEPEVFDAQGPDGTWYRVRLVPVPPCLAAYLAPLSAEQRAAREESGRARLVGTLTGALAQALTARDVAQVVADHVLPPFGASGLVLETLSPTGRPRLVGLVGYPEDWPERVGRSRQEDRQRLLGGRAPRFVSSLKELERLSPRLSEMARASGKGAWAMLPLIASGHTVGVCIISYDRPRTFSDEERGLLISLSGLVAQALERARLYDAEHERAQRFQQDLLPRGLPVLPAFTAAARYLPAGDRSEAGGDWYDALPLSSGRVALVIGDVLGHGQRPATAMGRLRTAVTALTALDHPPGELLAHLNDIVTGLGEEVYATCLYAVYDPSSGRLAMASAGHPPPAVLEPGGAVRFPEPAPGPPLGVAAHPYRATELTLPEGTLVALWTDGLVRTGRAERDAGTGLLAAALAEAAASPPPRVGCRDDREPEAAWLEKLCETVLAALPAGRARREDDAALLALRTHRLPEEDVAAWDLPEDPSAARLARDRLRERLARWGLQELEMGAELVVSELIGNVVRHAAGPLRLRLLRTDVLTCEVSDASEATPRVRHASLLDESGRGLQLVGAMTSRWGARYVRHGKTIWAELPLP